MEGNKNKCYLNSKSNSLRHPQIAIRSHVLSPYKKIASCLKEETEVPSGPMKCCQGPGPVCESIWDCSKFKICAPQEEIKIRRY